MRSVRLQRNRRAGKPERNTYELRGAANRTSSHKFFQRCGRDGGAFSGAGSVFTPCCGERRPLTAVDFKVWLAVPAPAPDHAGHDHRHFFMRLAEIPKRARRSAFGGFALQLRDSRFSSSFSERSSRSVV